MNVIFISPQFPSNYWNFCDRLRRNGVNVLGIGDAPYDGLSQQLKNALTEYYRVGSMEDYDQMLRAVAFFTFKYGKIDWIESNNEYWLGQDARLRTDFHVTTGVNADEIARFRRKSEMKACYAAGNIPSARCHLIPLPAEGEVLAKEKEEAAAFLKKVGYPVIVKPDIGVGACDTWKLKNDEEFDAFFAAYHPVDYVMEEFVTGDIRSYDAICDSHGEPLFESMTMWPPSIMDIVNEKLDLAYYVAAEMPEELRKLGRAALKSFGVKSRFVHLEFFQLTKAKKGLGKVGDFVGLEVNMRPAGANTPDMMNYAHSLDVYQIWADMVTADRRLFPEPGQDHFCVYAGRRDIYSYVHTHEEIFAKYGNEIVMCERLPEMSVPQMGNQMYMAHAADEAAAKAFIEFVQARS